jgi:hypothetical protein
MAQLEIGRWVRNKNNATELADILCNINLKP